MQQVRIIELGLIDFKQTWAYQEKLFDEIISIKIENRSIPIESRKISNNYLIFCEHPHVYTLGNNGNENNLLINKNELRDKSAQYFKINRGGDITYHGPGQIIGYPILDLDNFFTDIHKYLRLLEEIVIRTLYEYGIVAERIKGETGVWLDVNNPLKVRKICALGIRASRWVTMHGFAFNINTDLTYFGNIIPCGIANKAVTSLENELGHKVDELVVKEKLKKHFAQLFSCELI